MTNLSQWFDLAEQTPWEVGVYEVEDSWGCIWMCRWNGEKFLAQAKNAGIANLQTHSATICIRRWRGLSTSPEVKKKPQNKRKTMYVVQALWASGLYKAEGSYQNHENAKNHLARLESNKSCDDAWIETIHFRTPE